VKPILSSKEVNSQFAIFDESETQYIKNSMKFVTFPFFLDQKSDPELGKKTLIAFLFSPCQAHSSPIQLKDLGWDRKELKSAKLLTAFPKNCETIVEEPTLEVQETDHDTAAKESAGSGARQRSFNDNDDTSKASSSKRKIGVGSTRSFTSVRDGTNESQADDDGHSKMKRSMILVEINQSEELPPPPFTSFHHAEAALKTKSIEIHEPQMVATRSERGLNSYGKLLHSDFSKEPRDPECSNFQNTLNQLRSLRQKYSKVPENEIGRSISPKTMEVVKKQLQHALKSRAYHKADDELLKEHARSSLSVNHEETNEKNCQKKVYKSSSMNIRRTAMILPMAVSADYPKPEFKKSPHKTTQESFSGKIAKIERENTQDTRLTQTEAFSFGHRISSTTIIDTFNVDNKKELDESPPCRPRMTNTYTHSQASTQGNQVATKKLVESLKSSEITLTQNDVQEDSISVSTLQRIFSNASTSNQLQANSFRQDKNSCGLFKKIWQKKPEGKSGGHEIQGQGQDTGLLLSQMLDKVSKSRSSALRKRPEDRVGSLAESPQNIRMVFNNLFVDGIANISLGELDQVSKAGVMESGVSHKEAGKKEVDSGKPSQRKLIADLVKYDRYAEPKAKTKHKKVNSQHVESSKSSADKSIRSAAQNSTDNNKISYVKSRKKTIGTTADLINIAKSSQMMRNGDHSTGNSILNKSEKALKSNQQHLDLSSDQSMSKYHIPLKNSKFSSQIYPGGNHNKTVLLEDTDKSCAAIRQKVKDLLDPKLKGLSETPTNHSKRASLGSNFPVTSHKINKSQVSKVPTAQ
jgi:hypothetical protein